MSDTNSFLHRMRSALRDQGQFLIFRLKAEDYRRLDWTHLAVGGFFTWLVGIARNWDYPDAVLPARLGLYSVAYIFVLALVLWVFSLPLQQFKTSYLKVLAAVSMTAPYGLIYGIPVEMMVPFEAAVWMNMLFLLLVAGFRVASFANYMKHGVLGTSFRTVLVLLTPILSVAMALFLAGRVKDVLAHMGGIRREAPPDPNALADLFLLGGTLLTAYLAPVAMVAYVCYVIYTWVQKLQPPSPKDES